MAAGVRRCRVPNCGDKTPPGGVMCRQHWLLVRPELRETIAIAWLPGGSLDLYRQAVTKALLQAEIMERPRVPSETKPR